MKRLLLIPLVLILSNCDDATPYEFKPIKKKSEVVQENEGISEVDRADEWLRYAIEDYFQQDFPEMISITTDEYAEYKIDAINIAYGGLTDDEFRVKWQDKFAIKDAGYDSGFLIDAQDWGPISVKKCEAMESLVRGEYIFNTIISDSLFGDNYNNIITVIPYKESFLIKDVRLIREN